MHGSLRSQVCVVRGQARASATATGSRRRSPWELTSGVAGAPLHRCTAIWRAKNCSGIKDLPDGDLEQADLLVFFLPHDKGTYHVLQ